MGLEEVVDVADFSIVTSNLRMMPAAWAALVAVDLPGFGRNATMNPINSIAGFADWVLAELSRRGIEHFDLLGHSMGGMSVMALAEQRPELFGQRVVGVGLVATSAMLAAGEDIGLGARVAGIARRGGPPVLATDSIRNSRSSPATCCSWPSPRPRRSAGESMVSRIGYGVLDMVITGTGILAEPCPGLPGPVPGHCPVQPCRSISPSSSGARRSPSSCQRRQTSAPAVRKRRSSALSRKPCRRSLMLPVSDTGRLR